MAEKRMVTYYYVVLLPNGRTRRGLTQTSFQNRASVVHWLERQFDAVVLRAARLPLAVSTCLQSVRSLASPSLRPAELAGLLRDLSVMSGSGIPIVEAVRAVTEDPPERRGSALPSIASRLLDDLNSGNSLAVAFERQKNVFPESIRSLAHIGDQTGTMHEMLMEGSAHLDRVIGLKASARQAMIYPLVSFAAIFGAGGFWLVYVMPQLVGLFKQLHAKLPPITLAVLSMSQWLSSNWHLFLELTAGIALGLAVLWRSSHRIRRWAMTLLHRLPLTKALLSYSGLAFFCEYLALLLRAGLDMVGSLSILEKAIRDTYYRDRLSAILLSVQRGDRLSYAMRQIGGFPAMLVRMVAVGEDSGTLDRQLSYLSAEYARRLRHTVATLAEVIKPLIVLIAGGVLLFLIVALLLPVYDLVRQTMAVPR